MSCAVLDSGALIALERDDRHLWALIRFAMRDGQALVVPSTVVAQVWRGGPAQAVLARALQACAIAPFDELARDVGVLCGRAGTRDICDAHVALVAAAHADILYTSDPEDLLELLAHVGRRAPAVIRC